MRAIRLAAAALALAALSVIGTSTAQAEESASKAIVQGQTWHW